MQRCFLRCRDRSLRGDGCTFTNLHVAYAFPRLYSRNGSQCGVWSRVLIGWAARIRGVMNDGSPYDVT